MLSKDINGFNKILYLADEYFVIVPQTHTNFVLFFDSLGLLEVTNEESIKCTL
jgi:hypothetical protein